LTVFVLYHHAESTMASAVIPKTNAQDTAQGPEVQALQIGEIASNRTTGKLYLRKDAETLASFKPVEDLVVADVSGAAPTDSPALTGTPTVNGQPILKNGDHLTGGTY
jgi:hypothetical protein